MPREAIWRLPYDRARWIVGLGALLAAVLVTVAFAAFVSSFVWPHSDIGDPNATIDAGAVGAYRTGEPVFFQQGRFWLVRQTDGGFVAFSARDPFLGCTVPWRPTLSYVDPRDGVAKQGWYRDPCHGSVYDSDGTKVFGPSPRDLDTYPVEVVGRRVIVHAAERHLIPGAARADFAPFGGSP